MRDTTENTAHATGTSWATRRPKTLDELLDREEELAKEGVIRQAELLGGDARDLLNLPYHFQRKPLGTSAIVAAATVFLVSRFKQSKDRKKQGTRRPSGILDFAQGLIGSTLASAFIGGKGALPRFGRVAAKKLWSP
jgi:hypothetical protein